MLELFTKKPIFQGNDEIHQLDVVYKILGTPTPERWPGVTSLPWYELVKPKDFIPNHFRELFQRYALLRVWMLLLLIDMLVDGSLLLHWTLLRDYWLTTQRSGLRHWKPWRHHTSFKSCHQQRDLLGTLFIITINSRHS